jgi:hypothetical protein
LLLALQITDKPHMENLMILSADRTPRIALVALPALFGLIFCSLNAAGAELLCVSRGCGIYSGYTLRGVSIDLLGAAGFGAILLFSLLARQRPLFRFLLFTALIGGLVIDTLFLVWQILYWPCTSCLAVALLLVLCVLGAMAAFPTFRTNTVLLVLLLWLVAFVPVAVAAGKELLLQPWPALGPADAPVAVYFSPTCPACEKTVQDILNLPALAGQVAFYPIAKNEEDLQRLARMLEQEGEVDILALFTASDGPPVESGLALRWKLARNKMSLARLGADTVPLVLTPRLVQTAPAVHLPLSEGGEFPLELFNFSPLEEGCSADSPVEEACD